MSPAATAPQGTRRRLSRRLVRAAKRPMDGARSPDAASVLQMPVQHAATFDALADGRHALLVTYKRDGGGVPTPVWFAQDQGRLLVWTEEHAMKAKRLRRDPRALLAPCDPRGKPLGPPIAATGRVLEDPRERAAAAVAVQRSWNVGQRLFQLASRSLTDVHYLEFIPAHPQTAEAAGHRPSTDRRRRPS